MKPIPTYALYGEFSSLAGESWLHWETITSRSRLHGFHIAPHRHEQFFQLLYISAGQAEVTLDGAMRTLGDQALIAVPPLTVHGYTFTQDVEGYVLTLYARDVAALLNDSPGTADMVMQPRVLTGIAGQAEREELDNAIRRLIAEADRAAPGQIAALKARVVLLLVTIVRLSQGGADGNHAEMGRAGRKLRAFLVLIDTHYRDTRAIAFYASRLGVTPTHLNRICRGVLGVSALAVIERRIMLEARRYLRFSTLPVKEIAILLGYPDPAYFSRFFSQRMGASPTAFRSQPQIRDRLAEGAAEDLE